MSTIEIRVSLKKMTIGDLAKISRGDIETVVKVCAACMVDPSTGEYYPQEDQAKLRSYLMDEVPLDQFDELSVELSRKIDEARKGTIPPA